MYKVLEEVKLFLTQDLPRTTTRAEYYKLYQEFRILQGTIKAKIKSEKVYKYMFDMIVFGKATMKVK